MEDPGKGSQLTGQGGLLGGGLCGPRAGRAPSERPAGDRDIKRFNSLEWPKGIGDAERLRCLHLREYVPGVQQGKVKQRVDSMVTTSNKRERL